MTDQARQSAAFAIPYDQHPMCDENSMIATAALEKSINYIIRLLKGRQTGMGFFAVPRTGKTHMIEYFMEHHPSFLGYTVPCVSFLMWSTEGAPPATKTSFYTEFLRVLGYPLERRATSTQLFGQVISLLLNIVESQNATRLLLFVDEAHRLRKAEFGFLTDIFNELRKHNIRMKTVLVGQPALEKTRAKLKGSPEIIQRFMPRLYKMEGVTAAEALDRILTAIDDHTEFPRDSGCTYTAFFAPKGYANKFRLMTQNADIWSALSGAGRKYGISESGGYTMQTTMEYLTEILLYLRDLDGPDVTLSTDILSRLAEDAVLTQYVCEA